MEALFIETSGKVSRLAPANGKDFKLKELYALLECDLVEVVQMPGNCIMIVDENGFANEKKFNAKATILYQQTRDLEKHKAQLDMYKQLGFAVVSLGNQEGNIVGNAILCHSKMLK